MAGEVYTCGDLIRPFTWPRAREGKTQHRRHVCLRSARSRGIMKNRCIAFLRAVIGSERGQCANNNLIHRGDLSLASSIYGAPACGRNRARPHIHSGSSRRRTQISCRQIPVNGKFFLTPHLTPNENMRIVLDLRMEIVLE